MNQLPREYVMTIKIVETLRQPCTTPARCRKVRVILEDCPQEQRFQQRQYANRICRMFDEMPTPCDSEVVERKGGGS